jgi:nicotinamidase-related amidase
LRKFELTFVEGKFFCHAVSIVKPHFGANNFPMQIQQTLAQLTGAPLLPAPMHESAIVILDVQNEYVSGRIPLANVDGALDAIARLLDAARAAGAPVIHVVQSGRAGGLFDPLGKMFQIHPRAAPAAGEKIIEKLQPNAFVRTPLHLALHATERKAIILAGFMTHMCVSATARAAHELGWLTTVIADASATRDLPDSLGSDSIPAAVIHRAALAALSDRFASVMRVADLVG